MQQGEISFGVIKDPPVRYLTGGLGACAEQHELVQTITVHIARGHFEIVDPLEQGGKPFQRCEGVQCVIE